MNPTYYKCAECGEWMDEDEVVWVDPTTGEASTSEKAKPYHDCCAPNQEEAK